MQFILKPLRPLALASAIAAGATGAVAQSGDDDAPPAIDPVAVEIAERAIDHLALQSDVTLGWFVSYDVIVDGREKITYTRSGENRLSRGRGWWSTSRRR